MLDAAIREKLRRFSRTLYTSPITD